MPTALLVSPHLDDAVFSCGGTAALLVERGWRIVMATVFTRSVVPAHGFALACQLDKGLPPDVDYLALRRDEDAAAAAILGIRDCRWLDLPEAPHRGYNSPPELFGATRTDDTVQCAVTAHLLALMAELSPDLVFAPQGLGNHVDHQLVIAAMLSAAPRGSVTFYRDTPYAIRQPDARCAPALDGLDQDLVPIGPALDRKIAAAQAYTTQIGFQFGGAAPLAAALRAFSVREGSGIPAERFAGRAVSPLL